MKGPTLSSKEKPDFNPADAYKPLAEKRTGDNQLLELLFDRTAPFLPTHVLRREEKKLRVEEMDSLLVYLRSRYVHILKENGHLDLARKVADRRRTMDSAAICREIEAGEKRDRIRALLMHERLLMNAEFLDKLGFLPNETFDRKESGGKQLQLSLLGRSDPPENHIQIDRFTLLREILSQHNFPTDDTEEPSSLVPYLTPDLLMKYPQFARLSRWFTEANKDFDLCINEAFLYLSKLFADAAPPGPQGQAYEQISDLGTKSFVELIDIILDKSMPVRSRFESMRLLEWALAIFSLKRNPVYKAQREVRTLIHQIFEEQVWDEHAAKLTIVVEPGLYEKVQREAHRGENPIVIDKKSVVLLARKVTKEVEAILSRKGDSSVDRRTTDRLLFGSREKTVVSIARKIFLLQVDVEKCKATIAGQETGMSKKKARARLAELRKRLADLGKKPEEIAAKPVGFDTLDDHVGFALGVNLSKPLDEYIEAERQDVSGIFMNFALRIVDALRLSDFHKEDFLWGNNSNNKKSAATFRVFKIHGKYSVEKEVFIEGKLVKKRIMVPVEIQIVPVETHLHTLTPGDASTIDYERRKARELVKRLHPVEIAGCEVYPEAFDVERFARALNVPAADLTVASA